MDAKTKIDWIIEYQKCKKSPAYFYNNYFLINGEKPKIQLKDEDFELSLKAVRARRKGADRINYDIKD